MAAPITPLYFTHTRSRRVKPGWTLSHFEMSCSMQKPAPSAEGCLSHKARHSFRSGAVEQLRNGDTFQPHGFAIAPPAPAANSQATTNAKTAARFCKTFSLAVPRELELPPRLFGLAGSLIT